MSAAVRAGLVGVSRACIVVAILLCATVLLAGWGFRIDTVLHPAPRSSAMVPPTALCLIMLGLAALALTGRADARREAVRVLCSAAVLLAGLVMALQVAIDLGAVTWDRLGFIDDRHRMSFGTAVGLVLLAVCVLRISAEARAASDLTFALVASGNTATACLLTVNSFDVHSVFALPGTAAMSSYTATAMMLLFGAAMLILIARQEATVFDDSDLSRG